jgi:transcriptional regulator with XRE-family HTH domain
MLEMKTVGKNIKKARTEKNMTQLELADILGVSYQAVSNWERGNTMPDIAKLPLLSKTLDVEISTLLGEEKSAKAITKVIEDSEALDSDELMDVAPILPPAELNKALKKTSANESLGVKTIVGLAPFLDDELLDDIVNKMDVTNAKDILPLAPYLSNKSLIAITNKIDTTNIHDLIPLAPFLPNEALDEIVSKIDSSDLSGIQALAPFLSNTALDTIVDKAIETDNVSALTKTACFLGHKSLKKIANHLIQSDDSKTLSKFSMYI